MRLTLQQQTAITAAAKNTFGESTSVWLFGSRADDSKKGGDIDLLFETDHRVGDHVATVGALYVALIRKLGDRKIDVLLKDAATPTAPVLTIARQTGIQL